MLAAAAWTLWLRPRRTVVRRLDLALPHWPASLDGLTVAVIADLHAGGLHVDERRIGRLVERVSRERPELAVLLGDYVDPHAPMAEHVPVEAVARRLGAIEAPLGLYAVLGNHDRAYGTDRVARALAGSGITVLTGDAVEVTLAERGARDATIGDGAAGPTALLLVGVSERDSEEADPPETLLERDRGMPTIVLSHSPDVFPAIPQHVSLTIAGHTHAGQLNVPLLRERVIPSRFGTRFRHGHIVEGGRHLLVSAGVGTSRLPARFRAPPEVLVARLGAGPADG